MLEIFIHFTMLWICTCRGVFHHKPLWTLRSTHVHDALCRVMCQCVYAHCTCKWGVWSRRQKLCAAGLVGPQRTVQNTVENRRWITRMNWLLCLTLPNTYIVKARPHCPPHPPLPRNVVPLFPQLCPPSTSSCNACISDAWVPEHERKLTFQAWPTHTYTYVHTSVVLVNYNFN